MYRPSFLQILPVAVLALIGTLAAWLAFTEVQLRERTAAQEAFVEAARQQALALQQAVDLALHHVLHLAGFISASGELSAARFESFARQEDAPRIGVMALAWAPRIGAQARRAFAEAEHGVDITELGPNRQLQPAQARPEYFPLRYLAPEPPFARILGYDLGSDAALRHALRQGADTGMASVGPPLAPLRGRSEEPGFLLLAPVYREYAALDTVEQRALNLDGFALGLVQFRTLLQDATTRASPPGLAFQIVDALAPPRTGLLYQQPSGRMLANTTGRPQWAGQLQLPNHVWTLRSVALPGYYEPGVWRPRWAFLAGMLFTGLLTAYLLELVGREARVKAQVRSRTTELRESEEKFRQLAENVREVFWLNDWTQHRAIYVSPAYEAIWGRPVAQLYANPADWIDALHPEDRERVTETFFQEAAAGRYDAEYRIRRPDGSERRIHDRGFPIRDDGGRIYRIAGIAEDITARREAEQALKLAQFAMDRAGDSVFWLDSRSRFLYVNDAVCRSLGYSREELLTMGMPDIDPGMPQGACDNVWSDIRRERALALESRLRRADGTTFPVEISANYLEFDGKEYNVAIARDISERKRVEDELRRRSTEQEALLNTIPALVCFKDPELRYVAVNLAFADFVGLEAEQLIGKTDQALFPEPVARLFETGDREVLDSGAAIRGLEQQLCGTDGCPTGWFATSKTPLNGPDGRLMGLVGISVDITAQKQAEERSVASLREKEVLLREVHHRVKNNMQVISSLLQLQAQTIKSHADPGTLSALQESQNRVRSMALVHERLYRSTDLARVDFRDYLRNLSRDLLVAYGVDEARVRLELSGEAIQLSIDQAVPCALLASELISNSLKHGFPDGRRGHIRLTLERPEAARVELAVQDDGVGIPAALDWQHSASLGLRLVHTLARQLGAELRLERDAGTCFRLRFEAL